MFRVGVQFLAGRFHATPWGRHVNEGAVEWPPSPWRVLRALIATGFSKQGWTTIPEPAGAGLRALGQRLPGFYLPPADAAHTRHYMPMFKGAAEMVFDTFVVIGRDARLVIEWDVPLSPDQSDLIATLFHQMSYLGRAESWIAAQRIEHVPDGLQRCWPIAADESGDPDAGEEIELLAPVAPDDYGPWREHRLGQERVERLAGKREAAEHKGKKPPGKLSANERAALARALPASWLDALCAEAAGLRKGGWGLPPGSQWVAYRRAFAPLTGNPPRRSRPPRPRADTALLALMPDTRGARHLPPMRSALARCEMLHWALVNASDPDNTGDGSPCLSGIEDGQPMRGHRHATLIPLHLGEHNGKQQRPLIDHVAVHVRDANGFDNNALDALHGVRKTFAKNHAGIFVTLVGIGERSHFADQVPQLGAAATWVSATPFVPPRFLKASGKNSLGQQIQCELRSHGIDTPVERMEFEVTLGTAIAYLDVDEFWSLWRLRHQARVALRGSESAHGASAHDAAEDDESADAVPATSPTEKSPTPRVSSRWRRFGRVRSPKRRKKNQRNAEVKPSQPKPSRPPPVPVALGLRLTFVKEVTGPITLGYASHFGLGNFRPADKSDDKDDK